MMDGCLTSAGGGPAAVSTCGSRGTGILAPRLPLLANVPDGQRRNSCPQGVVRSAPPRKRCQCRRAGGTGGGSRSSAKAGRARERSRCSSLRNYPGMSRSASEIRTLALPELLLCCRASMSAAASRSCGALSESGCQSHEGQRDLAVASTVQSETSVRAASPQPFFTQLPTLPARTRHVMQTIRFRHAHFTARLPVDRRGPASGRTPSRRDLRTAPTASLARCPLRGARRGSPRSAAQWWGQTAAGTRRRSAARPAR